MTTPITGTALFAYTANLSLTFVSLFDVSD
jgi:hypothetical protein